MGFINIDGDITYLTGDGAYITNEKPPYPIISNEFEYIQEEYEVLYGIKKNGEG